MSTMGTVIAFPLAKARPSKVLPDSSFVVSRRDPTIIGRVYVTPGFPDERIVEIRGKEYGEEMGGIESIARDWSPLGDDVLGVWRCTRCNRHYPHMRGVPNVRPDCLGRDGEPHEPVRAIKVKWKGPYL